MDTSLDVLNMCSGKFDTSMGASVGDVEQEKGRVTVQDISFNLKKSDSDESELSRLLLMFRFLPGPKERIRPA